MNWGNRWARQQRQDILLASWVINNSLSATFRVGSGATMIGASLSLALIGV